MTIHDTLRGQRALTCVVTVLGHNARKSPVHAGLTHVHAEKTHARIRFCKPSVVGSNPTTGSNFRVCRDSIELVASRYAAAVRLLGGDGSRIETAIKFFLARNRENLPHKTVAEVVEVLIEAKARSKKSKRYLQDLRSRLYRLADAFKVEISSVTGTDLQHWLDGLKVSRQTVKNFRTVVGTLFTFAERRGYILRGANPLGDPGSWLVRARQRTGAVGLSHYDCDSR